MPKKITPREANAQELAALLHGHPAASRGEEFLSTLGQFATDRVLQAAFEQEQTDGLGRGRYERRTAAPGYRNGYEDGTRKTADGVLRVNVPQVRGLDEPYRSPVWANLAKTSDHLKTRIVEMCGGGGHNEPLQWREKRRGDNSCCRKVLSVPGPTR